MLDLKILKEEKDHEVDIEDSETVSIMDLLE